MVSETHEFQSRKKVAGAAPHTAREAARTAKAEGKAEGKAEAPQEPPAVSQQA